VELRREEAARVACEGGPEAERQAVEMFGRVADLAQRLEKLERRLGQNSRNGSLPPSSDRGQAAKRPARKRSGRKQGGQPGHEGRSREFVEDPDETVEHRPHDVSQVRPRAGRR
jgi:transposase